MEERGVEWIEEESREEGKRIEERRIRGGEGRKWGRERRGKKNLPSTD